jgi:apolipoprotein N-acyltransferase
VAIAQLDARSAPLLWITWAPWLVWLDGERSLRGVIAASALLSLVFVAAVFGWFATGIAAWAQLPAWQGWLVLLLVTPVIQPQVVVWSVWRALLRRRGVAGAALVAASACAYVAADAFLPKLFADTFGHGLFPARRLRQAADLAGAHGLTLALLAGNECVAAAWRARPRGWRGAARPLAVLAAIAGALLAYGSFRLAQPASAAEPLRAGLVQADISRYARLRDELGAFDAVRNILDAHFSLSAQALAAEPLDLVAWPETVYPTTFGAPKSEAGADFDREIAAFVLETGVPLVFGAYDVEGADEFNAAIFLAAGDGARVEFDAYRKASLFPLTERVPALLDAAWLRAALPWLGAWKPGPGAGVIDLSLHGGRRVRIAPLICYDAVAPGLARASVRDGAEVLLTLSNDSWFAEGNGPLLHLAVAAFRSIETRRPQLRVTNTGISAAIDATGEVVASAGVHERTVLVAGVRPERRASTLALAWGDWIGAPALAAAALLTWRRRA